jgi:hypothetical protein
MVRAIDDSTPEEMKYLLQSYARAFSRECAPPNGPPAWSEIKRQSIYKDYRHTKMANGTHSIAVPGLFTWIGMRSRKAWAFARELENDGLKRSRDSIPRGDAATRPAILRRPPK